MGIERLKTSRKECDDAAYCWAEARAIRWALEFATHDQLKRIVERFQRIKDRDAFFNDDNPIKSEWRGWLEWLYEVIHGCRPTDFSGKSYDRDEFLNVAFDDFWDEYLENPHVVRGFLNGCEKVWWQDNKPNQ